MRTKVCQVLLDVVFVFQLDLFEIVISGLPLTVVYSININLADPAPSHHDATQGQVYFEDTFT